MSDAPRERRDSRAFSALCGELLARGHNVRFLAAGRSMQPNILDGDALIIGPPVAAGARRGQVAFTRGRDGFRAHRVVSAIDSGKVITRGDAGRANDPGSHQFIGKVISIERGRKRISRSGTRAEIFDGIRKGARQVIMATRRRGGLPLISVILFTLFSLLAASPSSAQTLTITNPITTSPAAYVAQGGTITYTIDLSNTSGQTVTAPVTVSMVLPNYSTGNLYTSFNSATATATNGTQDWTSTPCGFTASTETITCTDADNFRNNYTSTLTFVVNVLNTAPAGTVLAGKATAKGINFTGGTSVTANVTVQPTWTLTNTAAPTPIAPDDTLSYSVVLTNPSTSSSATGGVTLTMTDPPGADATLLASGGMTYSGTGTWTCNNASGTITCTDAATYPANSSTTFTFKYTVSATSGTPIPATTASVVSGTNAPNAVTKASNTVTVQTPSLTLAFSGSPTPNPVAPGGLLTYTVNLSNSSGVNAVANETVSMPNGTYTTFYSASASGSGTWLCSANTCTDSANYTNGSATTLTFVFTVSNAAANGTAIAANTASAKATNTATANVTSGTSTVQTPDISVTNTPNPTSQAATGGTITYTQVLTNNGTAPAANASFTETTPTNTTFNNYTAPANFSCTVPGGGSTGTITCTANSGITIAASGGTATLTVVVNVNPGASVAGSTISDTVTVSESGNEANLANNTATASVTVAAADVTMTQAVSPAVLAPSGTITYTETVTNSGPSAASNVALYQQTPANTTFAGMTYPSGWACSTEPGSGGTGQVICTIASLAASTTTTAFTFTVNVNSGVNAPAAGTTILNYADVTAQTADSNPSNNSTQTSVLVEATGDADLGVTGSASPTPVFVDSTLVYSLYVTNYGLAASSGTTLSDTLPTGVTFVSANATQGTCSQTSGTVTCTLGAVAYAPSSPITVTLVVTTPATSSTLTNAATVSSTGSTDPYAGNNTVNVITVVQPLVCATPGKDGTPSSALTGIVNTYYPPGTLVTSITPGAISVTLGTAQGGTTPISAGDLLLFIQMQGAQINYTNTGAYGDGVPGDPASGSTSLGDSGLYEFVTATSSVPTSGGTLNFMGSGITLTGNTVSGLLNTYTNTVASASQGQTTFQVIRVPQYQAATLSSSLTALSWNGSVGGVLALDVSSQLILNNATVALDGQGFRGGGGRDLGGGSGAATDYVTLSTNNANASKGEGIAGTPAYIAPPLSTITPPTTAVATGQTYAEGLPSGSYARGAPGNAGGGATDANPPSNNQNSGGGGGGNGGTGGNGGFGWQSAGIVGGFGGVAFPGSTSALVLGGGGGAGTNNDGAYWNFSTETGGADCGTNCTGIYSSGAAGGGIVIIRAGSITGTGTITSNGQSALALENDGGGGAGAGGSLLVFADTGGLSGLTLQANGGAGGITWPEDTPGASFPGNRHGPGGGGGGGIALLTGMPGGGVTLAGGNPGYSTLADDSYGATPGTNGFSNTGLTITQTPGTQSGAYCAGADLAVTNTASPTIVVPPATITYTQNVTNAGPFDALNAVFSEPVPANTTYLSIVASGTDGASWTCVTNSVSGVVVSVTCTNPDVPAGANGNTTFTFVVTATAGAAIGTQIIDTDSITSGTNDPALTNNQATATVLVAGAGTTNLSVSQTATPNPVAAGSPITYKVTIVNNGPTAISSVTFSEIIPSATPVYATFNLLIACDPNWNCSTPASGNTGTISATPKTIFGVGSSAVFQFTLSVSASAPSATIISETASVSTPITDPNPQTDSATSNVIVAASGQFDLSVTATGTPNPVAPGSDISYVQTLTNAGPASPSSVVFNGSVPTNTTLVSFGIASGWICTALPAAGSTGTITCCPGTGATCSGAALGIGSVSFPMTVEVNPTVAPTGSNPVSISNTISASPTTNDVTPGNNSATVSTVVASPSEADVTISKTASPEPVEQGTNLTYTIQLTNFGAAVATGVAVSDPLPTEVTYTSVTTTQGNCTQGGGTVNCTVGSMSVGETVTITINVAASTFSSTTYAVNTACVTTTTTNPNPTTCSSVTSTIEAPTAVQLSDFHAELEPQGGVLIEWHTKEEVRNLGFHVYREDAAGKHQLDPSLIAGSALELRGGMPQHAAKTYQWIDAAGNGQSIYWVEDVDLNGTRTMHGPAQASSGDGPEATPMAQVARATLLTEMNRVAAARIAPEAQHGVTIVPRPIVTQQPASSAPPVSVSNATLNGEPAVKISVSQAGWYQVTGAQLFAAGLSERSEARTLQLYAEGAEQPMIVDSAASWLGPNDTIQFYGTGIDTPFSGTRVYWLVNGTRAGLRVNEIAAAGSLPATAVDFTATTILEQRTTYFAALLNGENNDNFFGALVTSAPVDQALAAPHVNLSSSLPVTIDVDLQGGTDQQEHSVSISFNGNYIGEMDFANQANVTQTFSVPNSMLQEGTNTVTLAALNGDNDVSVVQSIALHYPHTYTADSNWLNATASAGESVRIDGFTNPQVEVFDITDPLSIEQLMGRVTFDSDGTYGILIRPSGTGTAQRTLIAFSADQIAAPDGLTYHTANTLDEAQTGAQYLVITHPDFAAAVQPLVNLHEKEGQRAAVVTTDQIFDAFNYGERSPFALQSFLQEAATHWRIAPQAVLLMGDASLDPRNYLGFGDLDFVPTRMIETQALKTASDDWLTDFKETGFATIPTGRIPADTVDEATLAVSKIVAYETGSTAGPWQQQTTFVADQNVGDDFSAAAQAASRMVAPSLGVATILTDGEDPGTAQQQIVAAIDNGTLLVDYSGHGAEDQWSFNDFFDATTIPSLTNGDHLPVFLLMDCLNGFFEDVYSTSMAEDLLFAPNGGAVAVWASSGFTVEPPQATMNLTLLSTLTANPNVTLGAAILQAKSGITDQDVRRTWTLFGDPGMKIPLPTVPKNNVRPRQTGLGQLGLR